MVLQIRKGSHYFHSKRFACAHSGAISYPPGGTHGIWSYSICRMTPLHVESRRSLDTRSLVPYFTRCESIRFRVMFTSLPVPINFFLSKSTTMKVLDLQTYVRGSSLDTPRYTATSIGSPFPPLQELSLTGSAIIDSGWNCPGWVQAFEDRPQLANLSISYFVFAGGTPTVHAEEVEQNTVRFFIFMLSRMNPRSLRLSDMSLSPDDQTPRNLPGVYDFSNSNITFEAVSGPFLADFLSWTRGGIDGSTTIKKCGAMPAHFSNPIHGHLTLRNIPDQGHSYNSNEVFWDLHHF